MTNKEKHTDENEARRRMKEQNKEVAEIKLVLAMIGLMGWLKNPNDNEDEIKELIHNVQKNLDDFANVFIKKGEAENEG